MIQSVRCLKSIFSLFSLMVSLFFSGGTFSVCYAGGDTRPLLHVDPAYASMGSISVSAWINSLAGDDSSGPGKISIKEPLPGTLLPPEISSIAFSWEDPEQSTSWLLTISNNKETLIQAVLERPWWVPEKDLWQRLKTLSENTELRVWVRGIGGWSGREILSESSTSFSFAEDPFNARVLFMRKPVPFLKAKEHPELTQLLAGDISSYDQPRVIMSNLTTCANCHTYSSDGKVFAMDVDYAGDKGAFAMAQVKREMALDEHRIFSWNSIPASAPASYSMGLFAQLSPGGRYLAATVNETSVFVMMDDLYFSQLFFPATGQIGIFDQETKTYGLLPGADLGQMVQTGPAWSPDGGTIAFSAVPADQDLIRKVLEKQVLGESPRQSIKDLNEKYPVQFDIYTVPFNGGNGGKALPLEGASGNGYSNYFPRFSPDGRWMVFTQSPTGLVLQPESRLCIVPAKGGTLRYLGSNMPIMNSWHSWSPNSRWIVFTCKAASPYTELFITHIDDRGESSPAVRLFRFSHKELAAMVPELIPFSAKAPSLVSINTSHLPQVRMAVDGR